MRRSVVLLICALAVLGTGCAGLPTGTYYPEPGDKNTLRVANVLYRAAMAAGDDPARYSFAFIKTRHPTAFTREDATFYISDGLAQMRPPVLEAVIAHEVAHEVLDHIGTRRRMTVGMAGGFSIAGMLVPGVGLLDLMVNPLVVRAFSRKQELEADQRAIDILQVMGDPTPRRSLAEALRALDAAPVRAQDGGGALAMRPTLRERLGALEPIEPVAVASSALEH